MDRVVKTTLIIDEHGAVRAVKNVGHESQTTEHGLDKLDKSVKGLGKSFGGLKNMIGVGLGALGAGGLLFGLSDIASKTKEIAQETEKFHTVTGLSAQSSLYYAQALKARGLSGETVNKAFGFLAKNLKSAELQENKFALSQTKAAAKGKNTTSVLGRQAQAFKELGINVAQFNHLSEQEKLEEVTKKFEALAPGIQKTRLERELFGRGGSSLSTVLEKNNLGLSHQLELVKKFFPTIKGGANAMSELLEKQAESKMAWEGLEFTLGQKLIPVMTTVMGAFSNVVSEFNKGKGPLKEVVGVFEGIAHFAGGAAAFIKQIAGSFGVKLGPGTLGGVLLAAGLAGKVPGGKTASKAASVVSKLTKHKGSILTNPALWAPAVGAAGLFGSARGLQLGTEALSPGYLKQRSLAEVEQTLLGRGPGGAAGSGRETAGGTPARQTPFGALEEARIELHLDTLKVAEAVLRNPRARRIIAESTAIYAQGMTARK